MWWRLLSFVLAVIFVIAVGGVMLGYFIGGMLMLAGFIAIVEGFKPLKWIVVRSTTFWDLLIFGVSVIALFKAGATIAMVTAIAGLGFSFFYAPIIRYHHMKAKQDATK